IQPLAVAEDGDRRRIADATRCYATRLRNLGSRNHQSRRSICCAGNSADGLGRANFLAVEKSAIYVYAQVHTDFEYFGDLADLAICKLDVSARLESSDRSGSRRHGQT